MKVIEINSVKNGSTGNIMKNIANTARKEGIEVYTACAGNLYQRRLPTDHPEYHIYIGGILENKLHKTLGTIWGRGGCYSQIGTYLFLRKLNKIKPDIIHIHNLHSNYIHIGMLFNYIKKTNVQVIWTLHDCWGFTGHCPYFDIVNCNKWMTKCCHCEQYRQYPESFTDDSKKMYERKKKWFSNVKRMIIVTPSLWLGNLVKKSFLQDYTVEVIHNGIDLNVYKPRQSAFREKNNLEDKNIILGIAFGWGYRKGLDVFRELSSRLSEDYRIVLIGVNEQIKKSLPENIIGIEFTNSLEELLDIYSTADVFLNPTREDNFPTTHLEALACKLPVITFNTGGAVESINEKSGLVVEKNNIDELVRIFELYLWKKIDKEECRKQALKFDANEKYSEYIQLMKRLGGEDNKA